MHPVYPCDFSGSPERPDLDALLRCASVQLFVDRARAVRADFQLTERNAAAVAQLCARLEGIPLALELAAAWVQTLAPAQILERLERRFDLLVSRRRNVPERHAALRAAIESSFRLLPPEVQRFFAALSVFHGGWTLEAAEAVTGDPQALEHLTTLHEHSLIIAVEEAGLHDRDEEDGPPGGMRYRMLETLRDFVAEQLGEEERAALCAQHYDYYRHLPEQAEPHLRGPRQTPWLQWLETEHENLRAALQYALSRRTEAPELGLQLAVALWWFWAQRSHVREARQWLEAFLPPYEAARGTASAGGRLLHLRALHAAGLMAYFQTDYPAARRYFHESRALAEAEEAMGAIAYSLYGLALVALNVDEEGGTADRCGDLSRFLARAVDLAAQSVRHAEADGDPWLLGRCLRPLAIAAALRGDTTTAQAHSDRCLALLRALEDKGEIMHALFAHGIVQRCRGEHGAAAANFGEMLRLSHELECSQDLGWSLWGLGGTAVATGQPERAARLLAASQRFLEARHLRLPRVLQSLFEEDLAAARAAAGEAAFAAAWAEGRALTLEQVMAHALEPAEQAEHG